VAQNVAGIRTEARIKKGPKLATLRTIISPDTDFFILTETKARSCHISKCIIYPASSRVAFIPKLFTETNAAQGGVAILCKKEHNLIENSVRESLHGGHYIMGIFNVRNKLVLVCGIYGNPDHNDLASANIFQQIITDIEELKNLFSVTDMILAGDFNCVLKEADSNTNRITKPRTNGLILTLIEQFQLFDISELKQKDHIHTYYRNKNQQISSRIDFILTNITAERMYFDTQPTIFDHNYILASISPAVLSRKSTTMKEYILASEEFLNDFNEQILRLEQDTGIVILSKVNNDQVSEPDSLHPNEMDNNNERLNDNSSPLLPSEADIQNFNSDLAQKGITALQLFSTIVKLTQEVHNDTLKRKKKQEQIKLKDRRARMHENIKAQKRNPSPNTRNRLVEEYNEIQQDIKNEAEARDNASKIRIKNFYKNKIGKNVPATFQCTKEKKRNRTINTIKLPDGSETSDADEIVEIMQNWYQEMANKPHDQTVTLTEFLEQYNVELPRISNEQESELAAPISSDEILKSIQAAHEFSASGPSGQSISMYKLLFKENPMLFTAAMNQLVFVPGLATHTDYLWIKERKIVYIPKKSKLDTPSDYRPLSMLEVLYKIPARILANRLNSILHTIIGSHQHGFMPGRGIQEPSLVMAHVVQEASRGGHPVQILSYDIENAFAKVSHKIIAQSLRAFGIPELIIQALQQYTLIGYAKVEVNGKTGVLFLIETGSGQGDPLSAVLYLIATEPCNRALVQHCHNRLYKSPLGVTIGIKLYADDNKTPLQLQSNNDIHIIHDIYENYTSVSGLKINYNKSSALCMNTDENILRSISDAGISIVESTDCLGIILAKTIEETVTQTIQKIEPKAIKRRIMATAHPANMLHKSILLNIAVQPIFNHAFMALPIFDDTVKNLFEEIYKFLWTSQKDSVTIYKRKLVSRQRIYADYNMGGLNVADPKQTIEGLQQNLLQKLLKNTDREMAVILELILRKYKRPTLEQHLKYLGSIQWKKTANKLETENLILSQAFRSMSLIIEKFETQQENWGSNAIYGHQQATGLCEISFSEFKTLMEANIFLFSHITEIDALTSRPSIPLSLNQITLFKIRAFPLLQFKLKKLLRLIKTNQFLHPNAVNTNIFTVIMKNSNISRQYRKLCKLERSNAIKIAPAFNTRIRDSIDSTNKDIFTQAYRVIHHKYLPLKTKENSFQTLNRTLWTNSKAFKSNMRDNDQCRFCGRPETMEHMLYKCESYAEPQWELLSEAISFLVKKHNPEAANIHVTYQNIVFNTEMRNLALSIKEKNDRVMISMLIHEVRRKIYAFRSSDDSIMLQEIPMIRRIAHLTTVLKQLYSFLKYISNRKWYNAMQNIIHLIEYLEHKLI